MQALTKVSHEHHEVLMEAVDQLDDLADCLDGDCLDTASLVALEPRLREVRDALVSRLIPHMETVEAAVFPTLERLVAERQIGVPLAAEHREIRRLVGALGAFADQDAASIERTTVLGLRRVLLRLYALLKAHLAEEALYIPILEDRLTPAHEAALARALDHQAAEPV